MRDTRYQIYLQPAFLICAIVLAIAGSGMSIAIKSFGVYLKKEPLPLKKSLDLLDENGLAAYRVVSKDKIENEEIVKALGTEDYIQWTLEDTGAAADSAVRYCLLFITYYELPDRVPHVPEECYTGSGYQKLSSDGITLEINKDGTEGKIPARRLIFGAMNSNVWQADTKFPVLYFFNVNGVYASSREDARIVLNKNIFGEYSYFCKVEWKFFNAKFGTVAYPSKEEAAAASQKLLSVILPILESQHWPGIKKEEADSSK
ncbi:MAG TPA: hypothetical protein ENH34_01870 [Phycisphaerales bacterium]|nr:hypothetical protein [Phycisphaerales bacterium]